MLTQTTAAAPGSDATIIGSWLYDRIRGAYVGALPPQYVFLSTVGDIAVWFDGADVKAMHLCDQRAVTLGSVSAPSNRGAKWSPDGRYVSFYSGTTYEDHGPSAIAIVDTVAGRVAQVEQPWGYVYEWSPDDRYVVLARAGYHDALIRLAEVSTVPSAPSVQPAPTR